MDSLCNAHISINNKKRKLCIDTNTNTNTFKEILTFITDKATQEHIFNEGIKALNEDNAHTIIDIYIKKNNDIELIKMIEYALYERQQEYIQKKHYALDNIICIHRNNLHKLINTVYNTLLLKLLNAPLAHRELLIKNNTIKNYIHKQYMLHLRVDYMFENTSINNISDINNIITDIYKHLTSICYGYVSP